MADSSETTISEAIRSREDYEQYEQSVSAKKARIEDPTGSNSREIIDSIISELDGLYEAHASGSANTVIIDADQRAFKNTVDVISERMKNQARGVPGEITVDSMVRALADQAVARESGVRILETMGALFSRGSKVAPLPPVMPTLSEVGPPTARAPRFHSQRQPSGRPEMAGTAEESEFVTEKIQRRTQGKVMSAVVNDEAVNEYEPLLLYRLCFDKHSFVRTLENFFAVSVLVKEQKLWIGSNKRGLPVVGSVVNRPRYLANHSATEPVSGPDRSIDLSQLNQQRIGRQQFNLNFNYEVYELQQKLFGHEDALIVRDDYDDDDSGRNSRDQSL